MNHTPEHNLKDAYKSADKDGDGMPDLAEEKIDSVSDEAFKHYEKIFQKDSTFFERFGNFIRAENEAGRKAKIIKDGILVFAPWGKQVSDVTELATELMSDNPKQTDKPMISKILSVKNFINMKDENGNFSWQELGASLLQIVLAGAIVYGAVELGIWNELAEIFEQGE